MKNQPHVAFFGKFSLDQSVNVVPRKSMKFLASAHGFHYKYEIEKLVHTHVIRVLPLNVVLNL